MTDPKQQLKDLADHAAKTTKPENQKGVPDELFNVGNQTQTPQTPNSTGQGSGSGKTTQPGK